jgi:hypothetical protein
MVKIALTERGAMNWTRGLFRLWIVGTVLWVAYIGMTVALPAWREAHCDPSDDPFCGLGPKSQHDGVWDLANTALDPPLVVLAIGSVMVWAFRGFRKAA